MSAQATTIQSVGATAHKRDQGKWVCGLDFGNPFCELLPEFNLDREICPSRTGRVSPKTQYRQVLLDEKIHTPRFP